MKKILILFLVVSFILVFARVAKADYAGNYQTYINSTGDYQTAYNSYVTARAAYLASKSLDSEDRARTATLKMLQTRDIVVVTYLTAISSKVQITQGLLDADKNSLTSEINTEISWYNAHNTKLSSAGSLNDLVTDSDEAKGEYNKSTLFAVYQSIIALGAANNSFIRGELNGQISAIESKIAEIKLNQDKDVSLEEISIVDIKNKLSRSQDKDNAAKEAINSVKLNSFSSSLNVSVLQNAQTNLSDSNLYLKEANQALLQIMTQIKTAD